MNTKLITFTSSVLAVGALVLAYGAGCGDDSSTTTNMATANMPATNAPVTNAPATNAPATNVPATNAPATNAVTNAPATNAPATNVPATNTATTNAAPLAANYIDDGTIKGYCFGFQQVGGVDTDCDVETTGLNCPYNLPGTSWDDIAMIGCNVNQAEGEETKGTLVPTFSSVCITGTGFERIQIQGPTGATNANDRWCANVDPGGGCIPLTDFNTTCWDNAGAYYANEPLESIAALQPSKSDGVDVAVAPITDTIIVTSVYVQ